MVLAFDVPVALKMLLPCIAFPPRVHDYVVTLRKAGALLRETRNLRGSQELKNQRN
jgi:hypothetical protein